MSKPTDTNHDRTILPSEAFGEGYMPEFNQASEDELQPFTSLFQNAAVEALIRTEKLKLLDEVRERVIGEGDLVDAETLKKLYDKAYSNGYDDRGYENSYNSRDHRAAEDIAPVIAKIRCENNKRFAALNKMEAEL